MLSMPSTSNVNRTIGASGQSSHENAGYSCSSAYSLQFVISFFFQLFNLMSKFRF